MHVFSQSSFFPNLFRFPPHPPHVNFSHTPLSLLKKNIGNAASQIPESLLRLHRAGRPTLAELRSNGTEVKYNITLSNIIKQESQIILFAICNEISTHQSFLLTTSTLIHVAYQFCTTMTMLNTV